MQDFLILRAGVKFRQGSGISEETELRIWGALLSFLQDNELLVKNISFAPGDDIEGKELRSKDLTDIGLEVVRCGFDKWLRRIDSGKAPEDISVLTKCLNKHKGT